jgi:ABC-2 type transport system ATP-binding protein
MRIPKRAPALQIHRLHIRRSSEFALRIDSLWLERGRVLCIAGANGSGKTTLIEAIVGLAPAPGSTLRILGQHQSPDAFDAKALCGFIPDDDSWIIPELTAREYFALLISIHERAQVAMRPNMTQTMTQLSHKLMFDDFDQQLGSLSHGNRKKVQIIAALIHRPQLLIVDELRNGLDPLAIRQAEDLLRALAAGGVAVLAATHDLWWAQRFADDIVMLDRGRIILEQPTTDIIASSGSVESKFLDLYEAHHA